MDATSSGIQQICGWMNDEIDRFDSKRILNPWFLFVQEQTQT